MLLTSVPFAFFFLAVFILYWFVFDGRLNRQNAFLMLSSYFFYGWFDWKFAVLLLVISLLNYSLAILIQKTGKKAAKKTFFISGFIINIGTLLIFKYLNFFIVAFEQLFSLIGFKLDSLTVNIILPLGISFYVFLSMSYLVDVYQHKLTAVRNPVEVLLTFSFFPIILAGPIHRPIGLLPQIRNKRIFSYARSSDGLKQILWGLFMKMLIADHCAVYVNAIFSNSATYSGSTLAIGIFLFTIQIYADFAGYSNLAIGIAKLLGFDIMKNFAYPYFARDIREFWKRWNISLTTWFRDYVFLPTAYSISRKLKSDRFFGIKSEILIYAFGITVTWMLTGLWHGANYTFIVWGLIQGFFLFLYHVGAKPWKKLLKKLPFSHNHPLFIIIETAFTLVVVMFSWIFFRADDVGQALTFISKIISASLFQLPQFSLMPDILTTLIFILIFFAMEWVGREKDYAIARLGNKWPKVLRWAMYYTIIQAIFWFSVEKHPFIYFQF
jgi:alginate O-acetyltransferase complex protein AlgI